MQRFFKYGTPKQASACFMILALLWLTISAPFVVASQEQIAKFSSVASSQSSDEEDDASNPFSSSTEEKTSSNNSLSEEYLHDHPLSLEVFTTISTYHKLQNDGTYLAFHGELLVPPPNLA